MLVVTIELWPQGDESRKKNLGKMEIALMEIYGELGYYGWRIWQWGAKRRIWRKGVAGGHNRFLHGPWDLLYRCLVAGGVARRNPPFKALDPYMLDQHNARILAAAKKMKRREWATESWTTKKLDEKTGASPANESMENARQRLFAEMAETVSAATRDANV